MAAASFLAHVITGIMLMMPGDPSSMHPAAGKDDFLIRKLVYLLLAFGIQPAATALAFVYAGKVIAPGGKGLVAILAVAACVICPFFLFPEPSGSNSPWLIAALFYLAGGLLGAKMPLEKVASDPST